MAILIREQLILLFRNIKQTPIIKRSFIENIYRKFRRTEKLVYILYHCNQSLEVRLPADIEKVGPSDNSLSVEPLINV